MACSLEVNGYLGDQEKSLCGQQDIASYPSLRYCEPATWQPFNRRHFGCIWSSSPRPRPRPRRRRRRLRLRQPPPPPPHLCCSDNDRVQTSAAGRRVGRRLSPSELPTTALHFRLVCGGDDHDERRGVGSRLRLLCSPCALLTQHHWSRSANVNRDILLSIWARGAAAGLAAGADSRARYRDEDEDEGGEFFAEDIPGYDEYGEL